SFYLYAKVDDFRSALPPKSAYFFVGFVFLFLGAMIFLDWNSYSLAMFASYHGAMQSLGLFLMYFCVSSGRKFAKILTWVFLAMVFVDRFTDWYVFSDVEMKIAGAVAVIGLGLVSKSFLGVLFASRLIFWGWGGEAAMFAMTALHGLEYALVFGIVLRNKSLSIWGFKDFLFLGALSLVPIVFTFNRYFGIQIYAVNLLWWFIAYTHYFSDSYLYRFQFKLPRQFILPLFTKSS
ncbi:MAG: hypothetical protein AAF202_13775, partial [Pseudomonadota bacterium]